MGTAATHRAGGRWLVALILALWELTAPPAAWAAQDQKRVLVLYSTRRDAQIAIESERELPGILEQGLSEGLDYYSEYIDRARFPDPKYQLGFRDFLRLKYGGLRFDLVIAMQGMAVEFLRQNRDGLFPGAPVVFLATSPGAQPLAHSTGVIAAADLGRTIDLAAALQPDMQRVFVVSGADGGDTAFERQARAEFRAFESRFTIVYLAGLPTKELEARLAAVPEHSIIYYLIANRDGAGQNVHPLEYVERLATIARAPVYCWVDSAMDRGIVGGSLKSQKAQTQAVGALALRVLGGEKPETIPPLSPDLNVDQVDWRQLQRWGISDARVPAGTLVRFREPSAWDRYKGLIVAVAAVLVAQTALITGLLFQMRRRRQAEEELRTSRAELGASYERIRDLGARLLNAQEDERARIARDLHDDISQQLVLLTIDLDLLGTAGQTEAEKWAGEALTRALAISRSVRDLSHRLHPARLRLAGLVSALDSLRHEMAQPDMAIAFTHDNVPATLPPDLTLCLFRVVQEALQNALKYSRAHDVSVNLSGGADGLALTIVDDGVGFEVQGAWGAGLGLISMSERLQAVGGTIDIRSRPGAGTRLEVTVPVPVAPVSQAASL